MVAMFPLSPSLFAKPLRSTSQLCIKILDLLTNRYHVGIVCAALEDGLQIELPLSARLSAGQRIHFALDDSTGVIARQTMRSALIRQVEATDEARLRIDLSTAECLAA